MTNSIEYLATVFNSTLRQMTPILLVALCAGVCSKVKVFNIALAANNLCQGHPIGALLSSALFGFTQSLGRVLQNTAVKQQLLECIPYIATIVAMAVYNYIARRRAKAAKL